MVEPEQSYLIIHCLLLCLWQLEWQWSFWGPYGQADAQRRNANVRQLTMCLLVLYLFFVSEDIWEQKLFQFGRCCFLLRQVSSSRFDEDHVASTFLDTTKKWLKFALPRRLMPACFRVEMVRGLPNEFGDLKLVAVVKGIVPSGDDAASIASVCFFSHFCSWLQGTFSSWPCYGLLCLF